MPELYFIIIQNIVDCPNHIQMCVCGKYLAQNTILLGTNLSDKEVLII